MKRKSANLFQEAQRYLPGGVNSPVRAFRAVGGCPFFIERGEGARIFDVDGKVYIDYVGSWGPLILGHAHPQVVRALQKAVERGTSYGAPTELEVTLARGVTEALPSVEMVRFVSSGTEAVMSALRVARAYTKRDKIVKFAGCYHGHVDSLLVKAGSGALTLGIPNSAGVPQAVVKETITLSYNNLDQLREVMEAVGGEVACVIVEPVAGNMGVVPPRPGFLEGLRELTHQYGALLIFDEVITGFRVSYGGAQGLYGVRPDLTCLGKIIGGGLPVGAYGGRQAMMEQVAPLGPVYQAGTLAGNPLAMTAGIETLNLLRDEGVYRDLEERGRALAEGMEEAYRRANLSCCLNRVGSMWTLFFTQGPVQDERDIERIESKRYATFFGAMLDRGISLPPSQFEAAFLSAAHTSQDVAITVEAAQEALQVVSPE
ncbi:MAG: glutamate-1-semialdehyde 2,1-aminomutase [Candidatus Methylomirabilales bacterium]|nr:glutamate-1-semialdehyde 2,1-aminomutase [candidate division NC10 bacterium]